MSDRTRWLVAICLWVVSLATLTGTLLLLLWIQLQTVRVWAAEQAVDALRAGDQKMAALWSADEYRMWFPTEAVLNFAALSAAVLLLAWLGRRWIAVALPFAVLVASLGPAYWDGGAITPHPIGTDDDGLWSWLVLEPAMSSTANLPIWPLLLGSVVQTLLALTPLLVAPRRLAQTRASAAIAAAVIPTVGLVIVAMVSMDNVTPSTLLRTIFRGSCARRAFVAHRHRNGITLDHRSRRHLVARSANGRATTRGETAGQGIIGLSLPSSLAVQSWLSGRWCYPRCVEGSMRSPAASQTRQLQPLGSLSTWLTGKMYDALRCHCPKRSRKKSASPSPC